MSAEGSTIEFRVRYYETDRMGTFSNPRILEWFECGRVELLRGAGMSYAEMESRGVLLPVAEAHIRYLGRTCYDDLLRMTTKAAMTGRARVRFDVEVVQAGSGGAVAAGHTVHAVTDPAGRPIRPPGWFLEVMQALRAQAEAVRD